jgi:hypothetical protein
VSFRAQTPADRGANAPHATGNVGDALCTHGLSPVFQALTLKRISTPILNGRLRRDGLRGALRRYLAHQGMVLLAIADSALSIPVVVYAVAPKYQVPEARLLTV